MQPLIFALIGLGYFGKHYLRLLQDIDGAKLRVVCNRSSEAFEKYADSISVSIKRTIHAEDIFRDPEINAVVIATPTSSHFELAKAALEAEKHVLVEKPMTATLAEAENLARIAECSGKILLVGHQYCYNDHIRFLKQKLDEGFFGTIHYVHAEHFYTKPLFDSVGCFWETATHELAILDYLFGQFSIEKKHARFEDFLHGGRDDFANVSFSLSGKIPVTIITSWCAPEKVRKFTIVGEKGSAVFDEVRDIQQPLRLYVADSNVRDIKEIAVLPQNAGEPLKNELKHFVDCVHKNSEPLTGYHHGLRVTKYLNAIMSS